MSIIGGKCIRHMLADARSVMDQFLVEMFSLARIYLCGGWPGRVLRSGCPCPSSQYRNALIKLLLEVARRNQISNKSRLGWIFSPNLGLE